jgi:hypothetical protein
MTPASDEELADFLRRGGRVTHCPTVYVGAVEGAAPLGDQDRLALHRAELSRLRRASWARKTSPWKRITEWTRGGAPKKGNPLIEVQP